MSINFHDSNTIQNLHPVGVSNGATQSVEEMTKNAEDLEFNSPINSNDSHEKLTEGDQIEDKSTVPLQVLSCCDHFLDIEDNEMFIHNQNVEEEHQSPSNDDLLLDGCYKNDCDVKEASPVPYKHLNDEASDYSDFDHHGFDRNELTFDFKVTSISDQDNEIDDDVSEKKAIAPEAKASNLPNSEHIDNSTVEKINGLFSHFMNRDISHEMSTGVDLSEKHPIDELNRISPNSKVEVAELGAGFVKITYRASYTDIEGRTNEIAIATFKNRGEKGVDLDKNKVEEFRRMYEVDAAKSIYSHHFENVIPGGVLEIKGEVFFVTMYCNKGTLDSAWSTVGTEQKRKLLIDTAKGKQKLNEVGIVWGDVHGGNILVNQSKDGELTAYASDFGCASTDGERSFFWNSALESPYNKTYFDTEWKKLDLKGKMNDCLKDIDIDAECEELLKEGKNEVKEGKMKVSFEQLVNRKIENLKKEGNDEKAQELQKKYDLALGEHAKYKKAKDEFCFHRQTPAEDTFAFGLEICRLARKGKPHLEYDPDFADRNKITRLKELQPWYEMNTDLEKAHEKVLKFVDDSFGPGESAVKTLALNLVSKNPKDRLSNDALIQELNNISKKEMEKIWPSGGS